MKNKKAIIILSAILVIVVTVCCILFIPSNKNKDIANEKENIYKDITPKDYGYDIPDSTEIEIDGTKVKLEDLDCVLCAEKMQDGVKKVKGVKDLVSHIRVKVVIKPINHTENSIN